MKNTFFILSLLLVIAFIQSKIPQAEIEYIKSKVTKKLTLEDLKKKKMSDSQPKQFKDQIPYDPAKIASIIDYLGIPETYNYLTENNITANVKDQGSCGCCWSMAATTALAYRYFKSGIPIDLSPQNGLSCYIRDCEAGNYLIDSAMNLVKNGTVTESCEPFVSGDGQTIPECPSTCEDGSDYKKYYAKEVYMTEDYYSPSTFYDIVTLILDQLVNHGPVVTGIEVYRDFMEWHYDSEKCKNDIYRYDNYSEYLGGHAVAVVGYGKIDNRYYWLLQNSWSEYVCDKGFLKVEMGQIGVENVAFITPYLPDESAERKEVKLKFESIDEKCKMVVSSDEGTGNNWENEVEINFKNLDYEGDRLFSMQCGMVDIHGGRQPNCYYEYFNGEFMHKGNYEFYSSKSLGTENKFNLDEESFKGKKFYFYGSNIIQYINDKNVYVSQEGSSILMLHDYSYGIETNFPPIWASSKASKPLSNCKPFTLDEVTVVHCKLSKSEVEDFNVQTNSSEKNETNLEPIVYSSTCGYKESSGLFGFKLDKSKYPVFKITDLYVPKGIINEYTFFTAMIDIEGSVEGFKRSNIFYGFVDIEIKGENITTPLLCITGLPNKIQKNYRAICAPQAQGEFEFDEIYLHDYYVTIEMNNPYEVVIKRPMKAKKGDPPSNNSSSRIKMSLLSIILGLVLLLV